jgi:hypothetical protein
MYRSIDIDKIRKSLSSIKVNASELYKRQFEPTFDENSDVTDAIIQYIRLNNKVIYGGLAQHLLIKLKNPKDGIYTEYKKGYFKYPDIADLEFYSKEPLQEVVNLTEWLFKKGFKYIRAAEAVHHNTYKIYVNYVNYCDISYMPLNNIPIIECNGGLKVTDPYFMLVDTYRVITDPLTSYWRLDKAIERFQKIHQYYPIECDVYCTIKKDKKTISKNILKFIYEEILKKSKHIVIGVHAYNYYKRHARTKKHKYVNYYEIIVDNYEEELSKILKTFQNNYSRVKYVEYNPFFVFMDKRCEIYIDNILVLIVHRDNNRCTVYKYSKTKKIYIGTFSLVCLYLLYWTFYYKIVYTNIKKSNFYFSLFCCIIKDRNSYLDSKNKTVLSNTVFKEYTFDCFGITMDTLRYSRIFPSKNAFRYVPTGKSSIKIPTFKPDNISGNPIYTSKKNI